MMMLWLGYSSTIATFAANFDAL